MSRVAVVTGAGSGMGLAISRRLARQGHAVALLDLAATRSSRPPKSCGRRRDRRSPPPSTSATGPRSTTRSTRVRAEFGPVEIMVTSAGIDRFERFTEITHRALGTHARGQPHRDVPLPAGRGSRHARGPLGPHRDDLVVERAVGRPRMAHYVASKGGVIGLTKALALELAPHGITVNTIPPALIDTPMTRAGRGAGDAAGRQGARGPDPGPPSRHPRRHRRRLCVPLLRGRGLHHRSADRGQRRHGPVSEDAAPRLAPIPKEHWDDDARAALHAAFPTAAANGSCPAAPTHARSPP